MGLLNTIGRFLGVVFIQIRLGVSPIDGVEVFRDNGAAWATVAQDKFFTFKNFMVYNFAITPNAFKVENRSAAFKAAMATFSVENLIDGLHARESTTANTLTAKYEDIQRLKEMAKQTGMPMSTVACSLIVAQKGFVQPAVQVDNAPTILSLRLPQWLLDETQQLNRTKAVVDALSQAPRPVIRAALNYLLNNQPLTLDANTQIVLPQERANTLASWSATTGLSKSLLANYCLVYASILDKAQRAP